MAALPAICLDNRETGMELQDKIVEYIENPILHLAGRLESRADHLDMRAESMTAPRLT